MKRTLTVLTAIGMVLVLGGCETAVVDRGAYLPQNVTVNDLENRAGIVLLSKRVQNSLTCTGIQETQLADGRLMVVAHLRNRENRRIQVQVDCVFKDAQGFEVDSTPFQNVFLDENAQEDVRFTSMNDQAKNYTIRVREAR